MAIVKGFKKRPRRCVLYGVHGVGKTTASKNCLNIDLENGSGDIEIARWDSIPQSYDEFKGIIKELISTGFEQHTLAIDTADWLEYLLVKEVCRATGKASLAEIEYGKGPGMLLPFWEHVLEGFEILAARHGKNVLLLAHSKVVKIQRPGVDSFQRYEPALELPTSKLLQEWADEVLFYRYRDILKSEDAGFNKTRKIALDTHERYIQTSETMVAQAKNRLSLPDELASFDEYEKYLNQAVAS